MGQRQEVYIFTFGLGQLNQGKAVRITAPNFKLERRKMVEHFGLRWGFQYLESNYYETCRRSGIPVYPIAFEFEVKGVDE